MGRKDSESPPRDRRSPRRRSPPRRERSLSPRQRSSRTTAPAVADNAHKKSSKRARSRSPEGSPVREIPPIRRKSPQRRRSMSPASPSPIREKPVNRARSPRRANSRSPVKRSPSPRTKRLRRAQAEREVDKTRDRDQEISHGKRGDKEPHRERDSKKEVANDKASLREGDSRREVSADKVSHRERDSKREVANDKASHRDGDSKREVSADKVSHRERDSKREVSNDKVSHRERDSRREVSNDKASHRERDSKRELSSDKVSHRERDSRREVSNDKVSHRERDSKREESNGRDRRPGRDEVDRESSRSRRDHSPSVGHHHQNPHRSRSPTGADIRAHDEELISMGSNHRNGDDDSVAQMKAAEEALESKDKQKPSFELSGKLAAETNRVRGVTLLFNEPPDAKKPDARWRLYVFKNDEVLNEPLHVHRQSCYLFGRERRVADIPTDHPSCSKQHAVLQYRQVEIDKDDGTLAKIVRPYVMDLGSTNGTFINGKRIESERYVQLLEKDTLKFGNSSREYVILHEDSAT